MKIVKILGIVIGILILSHALFSYTTFAGYSVALKIENVESKNTEVFFSYDGKEKKAELQSDANTYLLHALRRQYSLFGISNSMFWKDNEQIIVRIVVGDKNYETELIVKKGWYSHKDWNALKNGTFTNFIYLKFNGNGFDVVYPPETPPTP